MRDLDIAIIEARISCKAADKDRGTIAMELLRSFYEIQSQRYPEAKTEFAFARLFEQVVARREWAEIDMYSSSDATSRKDMRLWTFAEAVETVERQDASFNAFDAECERRYHLESEYLYIESIHVGRKAVFEDAAELMVRARTEAGRKGLAVVEFDRIIARLQALTLSLV